VSEKPGQDSAPKPQRLADKIPPASIVGDFASFVAFEFVPQLPSLPGQLTEALEGTIGIADREAGS
jgi:hypothetical protein